MSNNFVLSEGEIESDFQHKTTGNKLSRSQLVPEKMKKTNYVASQFVFMEDYLLYKFCQNSAVTGNLGYGAERYSPYDEG